MSSKRRSSHDVQIAEHLWEAINEMAAQMGVERDSLINEAIFNLARQQGFLGDDDADQGKGGAVAPLLRQGRGKRPLAGTKRESSARRLAHRAKEAADELEQMVRARAPNAALSPPHRSAPPLSDSQIPDFAPIQPPSPRLAARTAGTVLYLLHDDGTLVKISKETFTIGRGKHCDHVVSSEKASREHAMVSREGADYFIADLSSSNGTWFRNHRIQRRMIEDGDAYLIGVALVKFIFR